jgi:hypothetical protein
VTDDNLDFTGMTEYEREAAERYMRGPGARPTAEDAARWHRLSEAGLLPRRMVTRSRRDGD